MLGELDLQVTTAMRMQPSAALVTYASMLVLSTAGIEERIQDEVVQNPALEQVEPGPCPLCAGTGAEFVWGCPLCSASRSGWTSREPGGSDPVVNHAGPDQLAHLAQRRDAKQVLRDDLCLAVDRTDHPIAEYLVASLDDHGWLDCDPAEAAGALGVDPRRVRDVLAELQALGPPGIGARGARECLLLQLERWERAHPETGPNPLVREILVDYLELLGSGLHGRIARLTGRTEAEVRRAHEFIRAELRPYPMLAGDDTDGLAPIREAVVRPDVLIVERPEQPGAFEVALVEPRCTSLGVNPAYRGIGAQAGPDAPRKQAARQLDRARSFVSCLRERWRTIKAIAEYLVQRQRDFVKHGPAHLSPLTRHEVASALGLHESTVSRAVADKYAQLPSGQVVPMSTFFDASLRVREALKQTIAAEQTPLCDAELAKLLTGQGYRVARRTVAKYRGELGIPAHTAR